MQYFEKFSSNTTAGSGNQSFFNMDEGEVRTGRILYKITVSGEYDYSILFSNIIDSTYADGSKSHKNLICDSWKIHSGRIGKAVKFDSDICTHDSSDIMISDFGDVKHTCLAGRIITESKLYAFDFKSITFDGKSEKSVMPGEFFTTDPIKFSFEKGEYLCLELTFSGKMIPYHEESLLPAFVKDGDNWVYSREVPFAGMIGCDRQVKTKIGFLGDSITQGIGTEVNSYDHWVANLSEKLGDDYACWNLGIGYARANDAATDGAWLYKVKQNDVVFVCLGVNDIYHHNIDKVEELLKENLAIVVEVLKKEGIKVILQTVPPFNYTGKQIDVWDNINNYIKTTLKDKVDFVFDNNPYLGVSESDIYNAKFGGHPNPEGCRVWADALYDEIKHLFL